MEERFPPRVPADPTVAGRKLLLRPGARAGYVTEEEPQELFFLIVLNPMCD